MDKTLKLKQKLIKGIVFFLGIMLVFTILSRTIYEYLLPVVTLEKVTNGSVETNLILNGKIGPDQLEMKRKKITLKSNIVGQIIACKVQDESKVNSSDEVFIIQESEDTKDSIAAEIEETELLLIKNSLVRKEQGYKEKEKQLEEAYGYLKEELENIAITAEVFEINSAIEKQKNRVILNENLYNEKLISKDAYQTEINQLELLQKKKQEMTKSKTRQIQRDMQDLQEEIHMLKINKADLEDEKILNNKKIQSVKSKNQEEIIKSPITGVVQTLNVGQGASVEKGEVLATIIPSDIPYSLNFEVSSEEIEKIMIGENVIFTLSQRDYEAKVIKKVFNDETQKWTVSCQLEETLFKKIRLGERCYKTVNVKVVNRSSTYSLTVSNSAIITEYNKHYIYTIDESEGLWGKKYAAKKINVQVLEEGDYSSAIEGAVSQGSLIIKDSFPSLKEGVEVALE